MKQTTGAKRRIIAVATALIGCGVAPSAAHAYGHTWGWPNTCNNWSAGANHYCWDTSGIQYNAWVYGSVTFNYGSGTTRFADACIEAYSAAGNLKSGSGCGPNYTATTVYTSFNASPTSQAAVSWEGSGTAGAIQGNAHT